jgi:hypothetical protein
VAAGHIFCCRRGNTSLVLPKSPGAWSEPKSMVTPGGREALLVWFGGRRYVWRKMVSPRPLTCMLGSSGREPLHASLWALASVISDVAFTLTNQRTPLGSPTCAVQISRLKCAAGCSASNSDTVSTMLARFGSQSVGLSYSMVSRPLLFILYSRIFCERTVMTNAGAI